MQDADDFKFPSLGEAPHSSTDGQQNPGSQAQALNWISIHLIRTLSWGCNWKRGFKSQSQSVFRRSSQVQAVYTGEGVGAAV